MGRRTINGLRVASACVAACALQASSPAAAQSRARAATAPVVQKASNAVMAPSPQFIAVTFKDLPGWSHDDHLAAFQAFLQSCPLLIAASKAGSKASKVPTPPVLLAACDEAIRLSAGKVTAAAARSFFEATFTPHRVVHVAGSGLLTGYYEPVLNGSRTPTAKFPTPIHRRPADLVNLVDETMRGAKADALTHGRKTDRGIVPYATRAEIDQGVLAGKGLELLYLAGPVERFFMQVQGSGRIRLSDGSMVRVTYDGKNGHPYTSIGRHLIETGQFPADRMSLQALGDWLRADPKRGAAIMALNKSYVFFRELRGEEAKGALGVLHIPLTPGRSLAVDAGVHAIGTPVYVSAPSIINVLQAGAFNRLMIAQDVGSAIRGPERGDIYFGSGDEAGKIAGITKHPGNFFVLLPRAPDPQLRPTQAAEAAKPAAAPTGGIVTGSVFQRTEP